VKANLLFKNYKYKSSTDAVTGEEINTKEIPIEPNNGIWVRCEK